jgi:hypothetical protein
VIRHALLPALAAVALAGLAAGATAANPVRPISPTASRWMDNPVPTIGGKRGRANDNRPRWRRP